MPAKKSLVKRVVPSSSRLRALTAALIVLLGAALTTLNAFGVTITADQKTALSNLALAGAGVVGAWILGHSVRP